MDQGCPLSGAAYQFYNVDLLEITDGKNTEECIRFVDDTTIIAKGTNLQEAFEKLGTIMTRKAGG